MTTFRRSNSSCFGADMSARGSYLRQAIAAMQILASVSQIATTGNGSRADDEDGLVGVPDDAGGIGAEKVVLHFRTM